MELDAALRVLCEVHTRDDDRAGFVVVMGATPQHEAPWHTSAYVEAWEAVRKHLGLPAAPAGRTD